MNILPIELVLRVGAATVGACEVGANAGPYVERVLARVGCHKGDPWCAAYFTDVGVCALGDLWPCRRSASVAEICAWALNAQCLLTPSAQTPAKVGDGFALWFPKLRRWAHIGFVIGVNADGSIQTREGNTNASGSRDGWLVAEKRRTLTTDDRLIRWAGVMA